MSVGQWVVYLVRCSDNTLYCGVTNDLDNRLAAHNAGKGAKYTKARRPVQLVCASPQMTKRQAYQLEYRIKRLPANQKPMAITAASRKTSIRN
jgi:putative endonuclease